MEKQTFKSLLFSKKVKKPTKFTRQLEIHNCDHFLIGKHTTLSVISCYPSILTSNEHNTDGEDLLGVGVRRHISKTHTGQTAEGEVQSCDILVFD